MDYQSSFKIRALVQQLRPHVLEVLHSPDFRSCKAADEIRKKMKLLMDIYKEITSETYKQGKAVSEYQHPPHKCRPAKERKQTELLQPRNKLMEKALERKASDKKHIESGLRGSYIVGASAFGLNFITFTGSKPSYYGVTKESFRSSHKKF